MKMRSVVCILALLLPGAVYAAQPAPFGAEALECKSNSDCVLVEGFCGENNAINKHFFDAHKEYMATHKARCRADAPPAAKGEAAACIRGACSLTHEAQ